VDNLSEGMHTGIGASATDELDGMPAVVGDGACKLAGDGELTGLGREPVEPGSVVSDYQSQPNRLRRNVPGRLDFGQTNSMRAIGAASPWRGPSFRIRVYPPGRSA